MKNLSSYSADFVNEVNELFESLLNGWVTKCYLKGRFDYLCETYCIDENDRATIFNDKLSEIENKLPEIEGE